MAAPTLTYTITNGTTADATQVMQNYNDLLNGITDGTKDLSISALTCAGTTTLNGHVNLGNSSADDLTVTASLASTIPIKTTNTYDIGSSTKGLAGIYFGTADTDTARIVSATLAASRTYTLPDAGSNATFAFYDVSQTWTGLPLFSGGASIVSYSGTNPEVGGSSPFQATSSNKRVQVVNPAGNITLRLPTTNILAGEVVRIVNRSSNAVTVTSSDGTSLVIMYTGWVEYVALSNTPTGTSDWYRIELQDRNTWTPDATNKGTATFSTATGFWRRDNERVWIEARLTISSKGTAAGAFGFDDIPYTAVSAHTNGTQMIAEAETATAPASSVQLMATVGNGSTAATVYWMRSAAGALDLQWSDLSATATVYIAGYYYWDHH